MIFSGGALFSPPQKKADDRFLVVALKTLGKTTKLITFTVQIFPNLIKKLVSCLRGIHALPGVQLQLSPVNLAQTFCLRHGGARAPSAPLATPMS